MWTAFDYMYRDAGNFKAFGTIVLKGSVNQADQAMVRSRLSDGEFFIAEQVGVPPLYHELYRWSGGPTENDHCWHEFISFRETSAPDRESTCTADEFVDRFAVVEKWDETLSPHFALV
jgi:hypothetical protein